MNACPPAQITTNQHVALGSSRGTANLVVNTRGMGQAGNRGSVQRPRIQEPFRCVSWRRAQILHSVRRCGSICNVRQGARGRTPANLTVHVVARDLQTDE